MPMCLRRGRRAAPVGRALEFLLVARARSRVLTASLLRAELEPDFSPAPEVVMFERSAMAAATPGQLSIFPRQQSVSLKPKVAGSVCPLPACLLELALLSRRLFLF